ncbi:MAG: DUF1849 family protein [Kiloniellales bacterium]
MTLFNRPAAQPVAWALIVLAVAGTLAGPAPAGAAPAFAPHRAVYELTLGQTRANGTMSQARGTLEFEWADVCTGWTVSQRTQVRMATTEGQVIDFGWTLSALEAKDGLGYRFFIRRFNADGSTENLRGEARLRGPGQGGLATFSSPEGREIALPKGTLFPTAHSLLLMRAAGEGDMPLWRTVFDGSGDEGLFGVNAAVSQTIAPDDAVGIDSPLIRGQKSWRLHLAYFGMDETVSEPQHEQNLRLFANGVVDELLLDYGDFALVARLQSLDALPELECKQE